MKLILTDNKLIEENGGNREVNPSEIDPRITKEINNMPLFDADAGFFFHRQLEHIQAKTYDTLYRNLGFREHLPINNEGGPGISQFTYQSYSQVGRAKVGNSSSSELPRADAESQEFTFKVESILSSYGYNIDEINAARRSGAPLDARRAMSCMRSTEEELNRIAWFGDADADLPGFFTNTDINRTASAGTWPTLTPRQILTQINDSFGTIFQNSFKKHRANTVLLPLDRWNYIMTTRSDTAAATNMTIAQYLVQNSPFLTSLDDLKPVNECSNFNGLDSTARVMVVYEKMADNLEFVIPQEMEFFDLQRRNLEFLIPTRARVVGTLVRYPRAIEFTTGI